MTRKKQQKGLKLKLKRNTVRQLSDSKAELVAGGYSYYAMRSVKCEEDTEDCGGGGGGGIDDTTRCM